MQCRHTRQTTSGVWALRVHIREAFAMDKAICTFLCVCHHYAVPLLPAAQGAALFLRQDHCNLFVIIALDKRQKDKTYRLCFFRLDHQLSILRMPIPHQVSHRVLPCHNTLVIRKDHAAALVARFPVCQKSLNVKTVFEYSFDVDRRSRTQFQYRQTRTGESFDRGICC